MRALELVAVVAGTTVAMPALVVMIRKMPRVVRWAMPVLLFALLLFGAIFAAAAATGGAGAAAWVGGVVGGYAGLVWLIANMWVTTRQHRRGEAAEEHAPSR